jgi:hypothetical protein
MIGAALGIPDADRDVGEHEIRSIARTRQDALASALP